MTQALPTARADELLNHMRNCHACINARTAGTRHFCRRGNELVVLTLKERHG